jgi:hypothetical protein
MTRTLLTTTPRTFHKINQALRPKAYFPLLEILGIRLIRLFHKIQEKALMSLKVEDLRKILKILTQI